MHRSNFAMIVVPYPDGRGDQDMGTTMTRPAFAEIFDLSAPFPAISADDPSTDDIAATPEPAPSEIEKFIARRTRRRRTR